MTLSTSSSVTDQQVPSGSVGSRGSTAASAGSTLPPERHGHTCAEGTFTVDVEDYFQVSAFADRIRPDDWDQYECRIESSTHRILNLAARTSTRGTFFVLGWVAQRYPQLIRTVHQAGHEIGCHSMHHQLVYELGPERFRCDLIQARTILEDVLGQPVRMYRAPSFSITARSLWAFDILAEEGFHTDSSIYPVRHDRYGIPGADVKPHRIRTAAGMLREFPGTTIRLGSLTLPCGGGGYFRLMPWELTRRLLKSVCRQQPLNFYIHPWELDPDQPRLPGSIRSRLRHYQNLRTTEAKLTRLLTEFRLGTMSQVLQQQPLPVTDLTRLSAGHRGLSRKVKVS